MSLNFKIFAGSDLVVEVTSILPIREGDGASLPVPPSRDMIPRELGCRDRLYHYRALRIFLYSSMNQL